MADELPKAGWTHRALQEEGGQAPAAATTARAGRAGERESPRLQTPEVQGHHGWPITTRKGTSARTAADTPGIIMTGVQDAMCQEIRIFR